MTTDEHTDITGRDDLIIAQALWLGIKAIDSLPPERRQVSNRDDMKRILEVRYPGHLKMELDLETAAIALANGYQPNVRNSPEEIEENRAFALDAYRKGHRPVENDTMAEMRAFVEGLENPDPDPNCELVVYQCEQWCEQGRMARLQGQDGRAIYDVIAP